MRKLVRMRDKEIRLKGIDKLFGYWILIFILELMGAFLHALRKEVNENKRKTCSIIPLYYLSSLVYPYMKVLKMSSYEFDLFIATASSLRIDSW